MTASFTGWSILESVSLRSLERDWRKALGMPTTLRNWNTVQKLAIKLL